MSDRDDNIKLVDYRDETQLEKIIDMIDKDLSEPYSIYTYRYFINNWPQLCITAVDTELDDKFIGVIVCKADRNNKTQQLRGYIAMLAIDNNYRRRGIGSSLVKKSIERMREMNCDVVVLETEITNKGALNLYERLGFMRDKRLTKYYLNGNDAFRLKLWCPKSPSPEESSLNPK